MNYRTDVSSERAFFFEGYNLNDIEEEIRDWLDEDKLVEKVISMQHDMLYDRKAKKIYHTVMVFYKLDFLEEA